jgi:hypothetical protein
MAPAAALGIGEFGLTEAGLLGAGVGKSQGKNKGGGGGSSSTIIVVVLVVVVLLGLGGFVYMNSKRRGPIRVG